jgi:hypothetical protein
MLNKKWIIPGFTSPEILLSNIQSELLLLLLLLLLLTKIRTDVNL